MFTRAEIICSLKHVRGLAQYGWTNVRQCPLDCVVFAEGASLF